jgi:diacylglycerol kinase (ATP)
MPNGSFSLASRVNSFRFAISGLGYMLRTQHNSWLHLVATIGVCIAGLTLRVNPADWRWLIIAIVLVWFAETINTAFGHLCDVVSPEFHASVKISKDIAAGAVLICAIGSTFLGTVIFLPYMKL